MPHAYGIYLIYEGEERKVDPIYIGRSGTVKSGGTIESQGLRQRLSKEQDGKPRNQYFKGEMERRRKCLSFT